MPVPSRKARGGTASCIFHTLKESSGCIEGLLVNRRSRGRPTALEARCESEACFVDRPPALFSNVVEESEALASLHLQDGRENSQGRGAAFAWKRPGFTAWTWGWLCIPPESPL